MITPKGHEAIRILQEDMNPINNRTDKMKVFLSWSGEESHAFARILYDWLPVPMPFVAPWMSSKDISKGTRWADEMAVSLEGTRYCIVCVTPGVQHAPWVNFEAGAASKLVTTSYVSPLLLGVSMEDLGSLPLSMFQCTAFDQEGIAELLRSINRASGSRLSEIQLSEHLGHLWPGLREQIDKIDLADNDTEHLGDERETRHDPLGEEERAALVAIAKSPGHRLSASELGVRLGEDLVRARHRIDVLLEHEMIREPMVGVIGEPIRYMLAANGRAYLVSSNLVP